MPQVLPRCDNKSRVAARKVHGWDALNRLYLDTFDYARTCAGIMEGPPAADFNARITRRELAGRDGSLGPLKTHLIPPVADEFAPDVPVLPSA